MKELLTCRRPGPLFLPKGKGFGHPLDDPIALPSWLSEDDVNYYASFFEKKGFTGSINYYRNLDRYALQSLLEFIPTSLQLIYRKKEFFDVQIPM